MGEDDVGIHQAPMIGPRARAGTHPGELNRTRSQKAGRNGRHSGPDEIPPDESGWPIGCACAGDIRSDEIFDKRSVIVRLSRFWPYQESEER